MTITSSTHQVSKVEVPGTRRKVGEVYEVQYTVTVRETVIDDAPESDPTPDPVPPPPVIEPTPTPTPVGKYPDPPRLDKTANTVLLWDWNVTKIEDPTATDATQQVSSANNIYARNPQPGDPLNSENVYTNVVKATSHNIVEMYVNHAAVMRPEGTAARLFLKQWGWMGRFVGKVMTMDFAIYLPDEFVIEQGAGKGFGLGVQNKNPNVSYGLNAVRPTATSPLRLVVWGKVNATATLQTTQPLEALDIPFKTWIPIRYVSRLAETGGWLDMYVMGEKLFHFEGRTVVQGVGPMLYNVNSVSVPVRQLVSNLRIDISTEPLP